MQMNWQKRAETYQDDFVSDLLQLLSINSVEDMSTATKEKPFGTGVATALEFMLKKAADDGFVVKNLDGYAGVIEYGAGDDSVGVLAHVDVVPAGDGWTTPAFTPQIRDGRVYARGAIDDKGPLLAAYYAVKLLKDAGIEPKRKVRFIIGTDEESGWLCMKHFETVDTMPDIGFSPDADFPIVHAEKGQVNAVLHISGTDPASQSLAHLIEFKAGERGNMVPDSATATITHIHPHGKDVSQRMAHDFQSFLRTHALGGNLTAIGGNIVVTVTGKAAHGMEPEKGVNAALYLAMFLQSMEGLQPEPYLDLLANILFADFYGENLGIACEDEPTGRLTVNAGVFAYSADQGGTVSLNIRYPATTESDVVVAKLRDWSRAAGWNIESIRTSNAHYVPADHPAVKVLQRVYEEQTNLPAMLLSTGGATYARSLKHGLAFGPLFPGEEMTAHQRDEYAIVFDLIRAIGIYAQATYELAEL